VTPGPRPGGESDAAAAKQPVEPGARVSIVGESGVEKSAILDLLLRLNDPASGSVSFDGKDARTLKTKELRSQVSILHDRGIWSGERSVRENLQYGLGRAASEEELARALRTAGADFMLDDDLFPNGLDTRVGEEDWRLGSARKRLLEVARALLAQPRLVLLDGPDSGLSDTEARQVRAALKTLSKGRSTFIAENHIEHARESGLILVLEKGRLVEKGTHEELLALKGAYYRLWASEAVKK